MISSRCWISFVCCFFLFPQPEAVGNGGSNIMERKKAISHEPNVMLSLPIWHAPFLYVPYCQSLVARSNLKFYTSFPFPQWFLFGHWFLSLHIICFDFLSFPFPSLLLLLFFLIFFLSFFSSVWRYSIKSFMHVPCFSDTTYSICVCVCFPIRTLQKGFILV